MTMLVTLAQAKAHLRVQHDADDLDIELKVEAASGAVINYLKEAAEEFVDSSGEVIMLLTSDPGDSPEVYVSTVPKVVQQAVLLMVGDFYRFRSPDTQDPVIGVEFGFGHLPRSVIALLYHYRQPTVA
jgi:hypothetical protein